MIERTGGKWDGIELTELELTIQNRIKWTAI